MAGFWLHWLHHGGNFPAGFAFAGVPLFAWNRVAKFLLLGSALVILLEVVGPERVEDGFARRHGRALEALDGIETRRRQFLRWLTEQLSLLWGLARYLASRGRPSQAFTRGRKSLPLAVALLVILAVSFNVAFLASAGTFWTVGGSLRERLAWSTGVFVLLAAALLAGLIALLLAATAAVWVATAMVLRPSERAAVFLARATLRRMHDKGVAHAWRVASFYLLVTGFLLDLFTS